LDNNDGGGEEEEQRVAVVEDKNASWGRGRWYWDT